MSRSLKQRSTIHNLLRREALQHSRRWDCFLDFYFVSTKSREVNFWNFYENSNQNARKKDIKKKRLAQVVSGKRRIRYLRNDKDHKDDDLLVDIET